MVEGPSASIQRGDARLTVNVPEDAKIFVNQNPTRTPGAIREYISRNLPIGDSFTYEVRAEVVRNGQVVTETKKIDLRANENVQVAFNFPAATEQVETSLTLQVPANAKVYLGGNETTATGEVRVFKTSLSADTEWKDYKVTVVWEANGRTLTEEKVFDFKAGENKNLAIDFDVNHIADAR